MTVVSRHSDGEKYRCDVRGYNLNAWCKLPGSPFADGLVLLPNPPKMEHPAVSFGPLELPAGVDTMTVFCSCSDEPEHENTLALDLEVRDSSQRELGRTTLALASGEALGATVSFDRPNDRGIHARFVISFAEFANDSHYGSVKVDYLLAYKRSRLIDLCNAAGSDKGTEARCGRGFPHCYAIDYAELFRPFRKDSFNLLEIGLDASSGGGGPRDAPSLRVWREFFPKASLYGYDIDDFSFFRQDRTITFQGDQASRKDLERFIETSGQAFRLVIDDGSHASSHQQISLATLFRQVEPGGLYVVEDLNWQPFPETPTTLEVLEGFVERSRIESPFMSEDDARYLEASIERIEIRKPNDSELAVIEKKPAEASQAGPRRRGRRARQSS